MKNYQELAMRTNAPYAGTHGNVHPDLLHAALGLCDEAEEWMRAEPRSVNEKEELGDMLWFCALLGNTMEREAGFSLMWDDLPPAKGHSGVILLSSMRICGLIKKPYAYGPGKDLPWKEIATEARAIIGAVINVARSRGWTIEELQENNIVKLRDRFPDKFNADLAWSRDVKSELKAMTERENAVNAAVAIRDSIDGLEPEGITGHQRSELLSFIKDSDSWITCQTKEQRDHILHEYETMFEVVDTRMINGEFYAVAGWKRKRISEKV